MAPRTSSPRSKSRAAEIVRYIDFALQWANYGEGEEYILPEFGIQPRTYYLRLLRLLQTGHAPHLGSTDRAQLVDLCKTKLGNSNTPPP